MTPISSRLPPVTQQPAERPTTVAAPAGTTALKPGPARGELHRDRFEVRTAGASAHAPGDRFDATTPPKAELPDCVRREAEAAALATGHDLDKEFGEPQGYHADAFGPEGMGELRADLLGRRPVSPEVCSTEQVLEELHTNPNPSTAALYRDRVAPQLGQRSPQAELEIAHSLRDFGYDGTTPLTPRLLDLGAQRMALNHEHPNILALHELTEATAERARRPAPEPGVGEQVVRNVVESLIEKGASALFPVVGPIMTVASVLDGVLQPDGPTADQRRETARNGLVAEMSPAEQLQIHSGQVREAQLETLRRDVEAQIREQLIDAGAYDHGRDGLNSMWANDPD